MIFDIDNWREIGATLARNKTRTFLTAFGIFWGTAMLGMLMGGAQGLEEMLRSNFTGFATNCAVIFPQRTTMPYRGYQKGMNWSLTTTDIENVRRIVPELEVVSPIATTSSVLKYKDKTYSANINAMQPNYMQVVSPIITRGRFITDADIAKSSKVCVIGENAAANLFGGQDPIGKFIECDNVFYHVVGVVKQRSEVSINGRLDDSMIIPETTGRQTYNMGNNVHFMMVIAKPEYTPSQLRPRIYRALRICHPLHPDDDGNLFFMDISEQFKQVDNIFLGVNILMLFVGLSSLIAGIIGVGNIMWIVVKERTKEFGIRRAIGAKPRAIMSQILLEGCILTCIAGTAGICFATGILGAAEFLIGQNPETGAPVHFQLSFSGAMLIMALFLVLGTAAGSIPAIKAMKIKPIEALNDK